MAKRLIRLQELDEIEGIVEHHRKVQERIEVLEAEAAQFDTPMQATLELGQKANRLKSELVTLLEELVARIKQ